MPVIDPFIPEDQLLKARAIFLESENTRLAGIIRDARSALDAGNKHTALSACKYALKILSSIDSMKARDQ